MRKHGIEHYLDLVAAGRVDLTGMLTHTFALDDWRDAFAALATQERSGAIKVAFDQRLAGGQPRVGPGTEVAALGADDLVPQLERRGTRDVEVDLLGGAPPGHRPAVVGGHGRAVEEDLEAD